jgi:hypothetical protein
MNMGTERPIRSPPAESAKNFRARVQADVDAALAERDKCVREAEEIEEASLSAGSALALRPDVWVRIMSQYASVAEKLATTDPRKIPLPNLSCRGQWESRCTAWAEAARRVGTARLEMAWADTCVRTGDAAGAAEHAFSAGVALGVACYVLDAVTAAGRQRADASNLGKHSKLTKEERLDIGKFAHDRVLHYLTGKLPVSLGDAKGRAYRDAQEDGTRKYGDRMTKRSNAYPNRHMDAYMMANGLTFTAPEEQGQQS